MNEQGAIDRINYRIQTASEIAGKGTDGKAFEDLELAVMALEKQKAKKPVQVENDGIRYTDSYRCPTCGRAFTGTGIADYCYHCGQKLKWDEPTTEDMTEERAIEIVTNAIQTDSMTEEQDKALAVVQKAVDKQIATKPNRWGDGYYNGQLVYDMWECPTCGKNYELDSEEHDHCPNCGQKIDWTIDSEE